MLRQVPSPATFCKTAHAHAHAHAHTQILQSDYTLGRNLRENPYHVPILRSQLTKALPLLVPEVHDEIVAACNEFIPITEGKLSELQRLVFFF